MVFFCSAVPLILGRMLRTLNGTYKSSHYKAAKPQPMEYYDETNKISSFEKKPENNGTRNNETINIIVKKVIGIAFQAAHISHVLFSV
jgi:hypothetical protein